MKYGGGIVDVCCVVGLALPGVTVYRCWPDYVFMYAGAALLALVMIGWLLARRPTDDS